MGSTASSAARKIKRDYAAGAVGGASQKEAGRIASFVKIRKPLAPGEPVNRTELHREAGQGGVEEGAWSATAATCCGRTCRGSSWPAGMEQDRRRVLWEWYMQLTRGEEAFKTLKSDLGLRPIHHQVQQRVEAHILVAFLGYCLSATLRLKLSTAAPVSLRGKHCSPCRPSRCSKCTCPPATGEC